MARSKESIAQAVEQGFPALLNEIYGDSLKSVVIYGSYLRDSFRPGISDVNVLVILEAPAPEVLRSLGRRGRRMMKRNGIAPLILGRREFLTSADVFPMEYSDIVENHRVVFGDDVTTELTLSVANLRHQVEHQLRGSLLSLRKLAIAAGRRRPFLKTALRRELIQWSGSLSAILRGLLRLRGAAGAAVRSGAGSEVPLPTTPEALVQAVNDRLGLEPGAVLELLKCRGGDCPDAMELIDGLLERLTRLVEIVDGWESR